MMLNQSCLKILKNECKRNIGMYVGVAFIFLFMCVLPYTTRVLESADNNVFFSNTTVSAFKNHFSFNILHALMTTFFAITLANFSFGYLHNKNEVDFYHSFPIKRSEIFGIKYLLGFSIYLIPFILLMLLAFVFSFSYYYKLSYVLNCIASCFVYNIIYFLLCYTISAFAMMLTGKKVIGYIGSLILLFAALMVGGIVEMYYSTFFKTFEYATYNSENVFHILYSLSPLYVFFNIASDVSSELASKEIYNIFSDIKVLILSILTIIFFYKICLILYNKRKLETSTDAVSFKIAKRIIRIILVIMAALCGLCIPLIISYNKIFSISSSISVIVWIIVFGIMAHAIIEIIYNQDFKMLFSDFVDMFICIIVALSIFCIFRFDLFHYDTYIPKTNEVKEVMIDIGRNDFYYEWYKKSKRNDWYETSVYDNVEDKYLENKNVIENAYMIANTGVKNIIQTKNGNKEKNQYHRMNKIKINWKLNNGKCVNKVYEVDYEKCKEEIDEIFMEIDYKKKYIPLLNEEEICKYVEINVKDDTTTLKDNEKDLFINALKRDIINARFSDVVNKEGILLIKCYLDEGNKEDGLEYDYIASYFVYDNYNNVLRFLKEHNIKYEKSKQK